MKTSNRKRLWAGAGLVAIAAALALLVGGGLKENVVFFVTPGELQARGADAHDRPVRLGGQVKPGSVEWDADATDLRFVLRDDSAEVAVRSDGAPPAMFQEGIGVVVEGRYRSGLFESDRVMVKHSNEYSPPHEGEEAREMFETLEPRGEGGT